MPPAAVHALLAHPRRLTEIHPLIDSVDVTFDGDEAGVRVVRFTVVELVPVLFFRFRNHLRGEARWASSSDALGAGTHAHQRVG